MISKKPARRKCAICSGWFHPRFQNERWCCPEHGAQLALQLREKERAKAEAKRKAVASKSDKAAKAELRKRKAEVKPIGYWMKRAQAAVNRYVRIRDRDLPCISCGRHHNGQYHAGHYRSVAACSSMRFYTLNINKQCSVCNTHLSSNAIQYRLALIEKYGAKKVESIESSNGCVRYSVDYLKRIERVFTAKTKAIERRFVNEERQAIHG